MARSRMLPESSAMAARWMEWVSLGSVVAGSVLAVIDARWVPLVVVCGFIAGFRARSISPAAVVSVAVAASVVVVVSVWPSSTSAAAVFSVVFVAAGMVPWFLGRFWYLSRALTRAGWDRAAQAQRAKAMVAEQARLRERLLIAQDMHDGLGHELSLIALSAGALQMADDLSAEHRDSARRLRERTAAAVDHLGEVIGILRASTGEPASRDITDLVERARAAGLRVELDIAGASAGVSPMVEHAVFRVVQEGLTNVAKHAPASSARVRIGCRGMETEVSVTNGPISASAHTAGGTGSGLVGLAERARLAGGMLSHRRHGDEFVVHARFPNHPDGDRGDGDPIPDSAFDIQIVDQQHRDRTRLRRVAVAAVVVPLVTGALLTGGLRIWEAMTLRTSVLDRMDFDRLEVGQHRSEVAEYLPPRQLDAPPDSRLPPDTACEYYSITANPFDDRSGDSYRLCFRTGEDTLAGIDVIAEEQTR
ncbi:histidine kinase [Nocardia sp. NPDC050799]|uniref:sensor histidine kinase n=1 Tax=Nocardia sp. NPDC050799 TaxID=3154842 RepID=UPI0033D2633B